VLEPQQEHGTRQRSEGEDHDKKREVSRGRRRPLRKGEGERGQQKHECDDGGSESQPECAGTKGTTTVGEECEHDERERNGPQPGEEGKREQVEVHRVG